MSEVQYLIERGGERQYVVRAELPALLKDGWVVLGQLKPVGATVPQTSVPAKAARPKGASSKAAEGEEPAG